MDRGRSGYAIAVGAIASVQGLVIGMLAAGGYFYLDDIDLTAEGAKHPYDWAYVSLNLNDHFTPGLRSVFWAIAHFAPYDNGVTVFGRVLIQLVATLLMAHLLAQLVGPGRLAVFGIGLYAFSPLLVPSLLSLSSGVNLLPTHVGILLLTIMHVRFHVTRKFWYAIVGACGLLLGLLFWEKAVLGLSLPVLLTFLYLSSGGLGPRLVTVLRDWVAWLIYLLPAAAFFWYYLGSGYPKSLSGARLGDVGSVLWSSWIHSVGPTVVGGPWHWISIDAVYFSAAAPGLLVTLLGQAALLAVAVVGVRRHGWAALRSWLLVLPHLVGTAILLVVGRYEFIGLLLTLNFHYYSELAIPLVLAVVLCLGSPSAEAICDVGVIPAAELPRRNRWATFGVVLAVATYAVSYGVTVGAFERRWVQNPIRAYMTTAIRDLEGSTADHEISIFDTLAPSDVAPLLQANRRVSDIFRPVVEDLAHPVAWDDASMPMYVFDTRGHLVAAKLATEAVSPGEPCAHRLEGAASITVPLGDRVTGLDAFLMLDYVSRSNSRVSIELADGATIFASRRNGAADLVSGEAATVAVPTPGAAFDRVVVTSTDPNTDVCLTARGGHVMAAR